MKNLLVRKEAEEDLIESYKWYNEQRSGLGDEFLLKVEAGIDSVIQNPLIYSTVHKNIRRKLIRRFPFGIFYIIDNDNIIVLAVLHASRNPLIWKNR